MATSQSVEGPDSTTAACGSGMLNLDAPWSIGEQSFAKIVEMIEQNARPDRIVEFGSGLSSIRLALAFPDAAIVSIEGDARCFQRTTAQAQQHLAKANLEVRFKPLRLLRYGAEEILSYEPDSFFGSDMIDCAIIDGPPFYALRGRKACLYQVYSRLKTGGLVILDDYERESEKSIVNEWLQVYESSFELSIIPTGHQLAVLRKVRSVEARYNDATRAGQSLASRQVYDRVRAALLHLDDHAWLEWFEMANVKNTDAHSFLDLIHGVRSAYGVTAEQIRVTTEGDALLTPQGRYGIRAESFRTLFEIMNAVC